MKKNLHQQNLPKLFWFLLVTFILLIGAFYIKSKFAFSGKKISSSNSINSLSPLKLAYNGRDGAKIYNFFNNKEIDLGLSNVTDFLWAKDGQLAVLVQGGSDKNRSFVRIPEVSASTTELNYMLYLVDLKGEKPKLILPKVFGEAFWSEDSTGFYVSENYRSGRPMPLDNQSGLQPDETKTFFVSLDGVKKAVDKTVFAKAKIHASQRVSPDGKFYIKSDDLSNYEKIVAIDSQTEYLLKPGSYMASTFGSKWSPSGEKIAFMYEASNNEIDNPVLGTINLDEVLSQKFSKKLKSHTPSAESIDFDWIDDQRVIVSQLNYIAQPGYYQGNIGTYDVNNDKFEVLVPSVIQQVPYSNTLLLSANKKFFTYQISKELGEEQIVVANLKGQIIKKLSGRDPSWEISN